jgi:DNA-binding NarL/FixJ family response regulator
MKRKKILIIEDELIHGVFLKSSIENSGYRVIDIISKGEDAINIAIQEKPDLIISDILLKGGLSGVDTVEEITRHIDIPFIFLTALNEHNIINKASRASPYAIISKPYDEKILIELIDSIFK